MRSGTLVVGLGSPHGDDQIGWIVARSVQARCRGLAEVVILESPINLLHRIETCSRLIVIDAFQADGPVGELKRWNWPTEQIAAIKAAGTHSISLPDVLQMGERLHLLPDAVVVWGIGGRSFGSGNYLSTALKYDVPRITEQILAFEFQEVAADA
jgi:hydrogenase maturation protease